MPRTFRAVVTALAVAAAACTPAGADRMQHPGGRGDYAGLAARALSALEHEYYTGSGTWNMCVPARCNAVNQDWGADSLTYALYLHWQLTGDRRVRPIMASLTGTARAYGPGDTAWSDVPMWDAIADVREYQVTRDPTALRKAEAAFAVVDSAAAASFASGACPAIDYQRPGGDGDHLKTLETDSNYIKTALLLLQVTGKRAYLAKAERKYAAVRRYFRSPQAALYTVYVFDTGRRCARLPGRYYASANGNMIWAGAELAAATGRTSYLTEAIATARAIAAQLGDAAGVYADLQAENDVAEPLIEAMVLLATTWHQGFARDWLVRSASAAAGDMTRRGAFGRFFDGPPPGAPVTAWQGNGGAALMFGSAALDPRGRPAGTRFWRQATFVRYDRRLAGSPGGVRVTFTGRAIAIIGTIGEQCCQPGHAKVLIDGRPTFDQTGIWQNKSSSARRLPDSVLFAWRWPAAGRHTITIAPAPFNPKEGGAFFHMTGYYLVT
jgi:hypothetical protein